MYKIYQIYKTRIMNFSKLFKITFYVHDFYIYVQILFMIVSNISTNMLKNLFTNTFTNALRPHGCSSAIDATLRIMCFLNTLIIRCSQRCSQKICVTGVRNGGRKVSLTFVNRIYQQINESINQSRNKLINEEYTYEYI